MTIVTCQRLLVPSKTYAEIQLIFDSWWGLFWGVFGLGG